MYEKLWYLKKCDLFDHLDPPAISQLESRSRMRTFPARSPIYLPADASDAVYLLVAGRAKVCHLTEDGKQSILAFIEPGEVFGELALLETGQREEYVETIDESKVILMPGDEIRRLMEENPQVSLRISKLIGIRRLRVERRLKSLLFLSSRERVAHLLLDLAEQYGRTSELGLELQIRLSHQELASVIGSTRETVTVVLGKMQLERLVKVQRRRVTLLNPKQLADSVGRAAPAIKESSASMVESQDTTLDSSMPRRPSFTG